MEIVEVSPRDGLQNESTPVDTTDKIALIEWLLATGLRRIEAVSFVNPERVPQMADAEAVMAGVPRRPDVSYAGLVLNERGVQRAVDTGVDEVNVVVVSTDTFGLRNQGGDRRMMLDRCYAILATARERRLRTTVTFAAAFGCPFEGEVPAQQVLDLMAEVLPAEPDEVAFADTIGVGVPHQVRSLVAGARALAPQLPVRFHFHNTRNTGYANAFAALEAGADVLDASAGGIGGCPFAPNATGNIATEDLVYLLDRSGVPSGVDGVSMASVGVRLRTDLHLDPPALLGRAGPFPSTDLSPGASSAGAP